MIRQPPPGHRRPRRHSADPEVLLWRALGEALPRARFMRHVAIGPYVADFASRSARLIVEVDDGRGRDCVRTRFLNRHGYRLIRFWDEDVLRDPAAVLDAIACALPAELLSESGPQCRIGPAAARAEWSPRPDLPVRVVPDHRPMEPAR